MSFGTECRERVGSHILHMVSTEGAGMGQFPARGANEGEKKVNLAGKNK